MRTIAWCITLCQIAQMISGCAIELVDVGFKLRTGTATFLLEHAYGLTMYASYLVLFTRFFEQRYRVKKTT